MHALAFLRHHPHAGWPRSHLTFRVLHLRRRQLSVLRVGASAMGKHSRFTADAQGTLPFARRAALASVVRFICTRALVAPRRRVGRMVRQLCSAVGARRLLVGCRAAGSGRWVHGERLDWGVALERAGVFFGEAETEPSSVRRGYGRLASSPAFVTNPPPASSTPADWWPSSPEADIGARGTLNTM